MKLLCLFGLFAYVAVQGAVLNDEGITSGTKSFSNLHIKLSHASHTSGPSEADLQLISELQQLEQPQGRNVVTDAIHNALEGLRDVIVNGNDNVGPMDPLEVPRIGPFEYKAPAVSITGEVNDFSMTGLRWFVLDRVSFNPLTLAFGTHVTIPWVTISGNYNANGYLALLQHTAGGVFNIFVHRIELGLDMRMGASILGGGSLFLRTLEIKIDIHDTQVSISGLTGSSVLNSLINSILQSSTQDIIQNQLENVSQTLSNELFDIINDVLKDFTINDILG